MRCEGADNPPCRRCKNTGLECLFEKPSREATLTGEAGLERMRNLEGHVADIKNHQLAMADTLNEIYSFIRGGALNARSPHALHAYNHSPAMQSMATPPASTPIATDYRGHRGSMHSVDYSQPSDIQSSGSSHSGQQAPLLPPFSSLQAAPRHHSSDPNKEMPRFLNAPPPGSKRAAAPSNNPSAHSSDVEEDGEGLPSSGLVAPWEVLRGLADVAVEQAARENGDSSEPASRAPSPGRHRTKRRKTNHGKNARSVFFPDVVTKEIISEVEARQLFQIFYSGCSTFLSVFDANVDTYEALHERSPFAVNAICTVAVLVRDGSGRRSETYRKCLEEVQTMARGTLFSPVSRIEAVQAMILVSGWSENGWLSGGHAVRMALELSMHRAWPRLVRRMNAGKASDSAEDRELVVASRTWFTLYLFEHQLSYGTGRLAILKDDESIWDCRRILQHPLAIEDDMRLVSSVELMAVRERLHNRLTPFDTVIDDNVITMLNSAHEEFRIWFATWDKVFSQKYVDSAFYRQSLHIQHIHCELFHNAVALRGMHGPEDVHKMSKLQRELAIKTIHAAVQALDLTVNSPAYTDGFRYAVHYTHATVTFASSLLLRLTKLFPEEVDVNDIRAKVERLAVMLSQVSGKRYALTLQLMLERSQKRHSNSRSPTFAREGYPVANHTHDNNGMVMPHHQHNHQSQQPFSPTYDTHHHQYPPALPHSSNDVFAHNDPRFVGAPQHAVDAEQIWQSFQTIGREQLPIWLNDHNLGGSSFVQQGMNAYFVPPEYLPAAPQIW